MISDIFLGEFAPACTARIIANRCCKYLCSHQVAYFASDLNIDFFFLHSTCIRFQVLHAPTFSDHIGGLLRYRGTVVG